MFHRKLTGKSLAATLMAAASATALLAMPACAQQTPADDTRLNVVIITANQREENLQDVPVSAASLPQEQIESIFSSGEDVLALAARVPPSTPRAPTAASPRASTSAASATPISTSPPRSPSRSSWTMS